jgi:hypothetical protein
VPTVTQDDVQAWLDAYVEAWHTYDPAAIAALLTGDAKYAYHPWDEGEGLSRGRDAIVADCGSRSRTSPARGRLTTNLW